jgi:hypothetical protein
MAALVRNLAKKFSRPLKLMRLQNVDKNTYVYHCQCNGFMTDLQKMNSSSVHATQHVMTMVLTVGLPYMRFSDGCIVCISLQKAIKNDAGKPLEPF